MLKTNKNISIDLKRRQNILNLDAINVGSCITIATVIIIFVLSVVVFASYPNSNIPTNI